MGELQGARMSRGEAPHGSQGLAGWDEAGSGSIPWETGVQGHLPSPGARGGSSNNTTFPALLKMAIKQQINTQP